MLELERHLKLDRAAIRAPNLTDRFTDADLSRIADFCWDGFEKDRQSREGWFKRTEAAMDLAMQVAQEKSFPWPNASNVIFPLVTIAALQFHARAYPQIIQGANVVKCRVALNASTEAIQKAYRVSQYMSYQVLEEDQSWEEQNDRMLLNIAIVGCGFKKSYYNAKTGHNSSHFVRARDLVVDYWAKSIEAARRKTHVIPLYRNDIVERCLTGLYRDVREEAWLKATAQYVSESVDDKSDKRVGKEEPVNDWAAPYRGLEQHCWLDLDGDGYEEPYVVTFEESSKDVLRIVSRVDREEDISYIGKSIAGINAAEYFTKFDFLPSPDGGIYGVGFGVLLGPLNEAVNSLINQLIDAGTMATTAGGFLGRGAKIRGGVYTFTPMEWKRIDSPGDDIKKNIFPLPVREPSDVLFKLLSLLIDYTNRVSGATEIMTGENPGQNTKVGTTNAMVEQGLKIYSGIFKRVWRSLKEEFKKLYVLNAIHLPVRKVGLTGVMALREDFLDDPNIIVPYADPNLVSDQQRLQQAALLAERARTVPGYNPEAIERQFLTALRIDNIAEIFPGPQKTGPLPNPKIQVEQEKTRREQLKLKQEKELFLFEIQEEHDLNSAKISELEAQATKLLADAKGAGVELQIQAINSIVGAMKERNKAIHDRAQVILDSLKSKEDERDNSGAISHLVGGPGNTGPAGSPPGNAPGGDGGMGAGGLGQ